MNVGPCISPPPSPAETASATARVQSVGGERHVAAGQRLADAHHVGSDARVLAREQRARAPEAGRDLVEHEQQAVLVAQPPQQRDALGRVEAHAARALHDGLDTIAASSSRVARDELAHVRRPALVKARVEPVGRALGEDVLGQHAREQAVHPADRIAHGHRAERVAVIAAAHRQQPRALRRVRARAGTAGTS